MLRLSLWAAALTAALALAGCGSKCGGACSVLTNPACPHVQFNGAVNTSTNDLCNSTCEANNNSVCADNSNSDINGQVLDCINAVSCDSDASHAELAIEQCVVSCPTHR
ncbi:MAG: hypothetical protein JST54_16115 [Deltaproteobacteria bacterium]|nr:hypothetical protein [Deltaproteobacteria bacterium]